MCMGWGGYGLLSAVAPSLRGQVLLSFDGLFLLLACPRGSDHGVAPFAPPVSRPRLGVWLALGLAALYLPGLSCPRLGWAGWCGLLWYLRGLGWPSLRSWVRPGDPPLLHGASGWGCGVVA